MLDKLRQRASDEAVQAGLSPDLPEFCFSVCETEKIGRRIVIIKRGECGYYPYDQADGSDYVAAGKSHTELIDFLKDIVDNTLNKSIDVSKAQRLAMESGAMFGWHVPGANPDAYYNLFPQEQK